MIHKPTHSQEFLSRRELVQWIVAAALATGMTCPEAVAGAASTTAINKVRVVEWSLPAASLGAPQGFVGSRWQANINGSLKELNIERFATMVEQRTHKGWWWIGEQPGKWLESSVLSSTIARDPELAQKTKDILARLVKAQATDGYLGVSDPSVLSDAIPLRGMDPYEQYFTFHGLITAWEVLGEKAALEAATKLADYYLTHLGPGKAEFWPSPVRPPENRNMQICGQAAWVPPGTTKPETFYAHSEIAGHTAHYCWEGTLVIDPILRLYQVTGEERFLEWAKWVVSRIDTWSGWDAFSRLDEVAAGKIGVHQLQPYVHSHTFQMNFLGFLRLYQITGDSSYLRKVEGAWKDVVARQLYITGGVSVGEHYEADYRRPVEGHVVETCANMSWMELNQYLLQLSGDPKYADLIERLLVNHVFAAQTVDGDSYRYHTPPNGTKPFEYFHGPDCCTSSGHRLTSMLPGFFYAQAPGVAIVNQYVSSSANFGLGKGIEVVLKQETRFPEEETVSIKVNPAKPGDFTVRLRVPAWCEEPKARVNGEELTQVKPGGYLDIKRNWKAGDTIQLTFPMSARWIEHDHLDGDQARWALTRGPVVYAVDTLWWDVKEMPAPKKVDHAVGFSQELKASLKPEPAPAGLLGPAYRASLVTGEGKTIQPLFVPFANAGVWYKDPSNKPPKNSAAYSYAVWLYGADLPVFKEAYTRAQKYAELIRSSIDFVLVGDRKSEADHKLEGTSRSGKFQDQSYRDGKQFSWNLEVSTESPTMVVVTYWGGDRGREFDIFANDQLIATQKLDNDNPGQFIDFRYQIPFELVQNQTDAIGQKVNKVRIAFQARENQIAGGVFGIRTEKAR